MRLSKVVKWGSIVFIVGLIGSLITIKDELIEQWNQVNNQDSIVLKGVFCSSGNDSDKRGYIFVNDIIERVLEGHNINIDDKIVLTGIDGRQLDSVDELTVRSIILLPNTLEGSDYCNFALTPGVNRLLKVSTKGDVKTRDEHVLEVKKVD